jgi:hypothetical protein
MKGIRSFSLIRFFGLALLAACFVAGHANAQVARGKFTLPFEARWGQATLPAGDYAFKLDRLDSTCMIYLYRGGYSVGMIPAQSEDWSYSGHASLTVVEGTVRALKLPAIGMVFQYAPQRPKHLTAPAERELAQFVPVSLAGK